MKAKPTPSQNGRTAAGRFAAGNAGGPGRPPGCRLAELRDAITETVTTADVRAVVAAVVERARRGERWAVTELLRALTAAQPPAPAVTPPRPPPEPTVEQIRFAAAAIGMPLPDDDDAAREIFDQLPEV